VRVRTHLFEKGVVNDHVLLFIDQPPHQSALRARGKWRKALVQPLLADYLLALPLTFVEDQLADLGKILGLDLQTGHAKGIALCIGTPRDIRDRKLVKKMPFEERVKLHA